MAHTCSLNLLPLKLIGRLTSNVLDVVCDTRPSNQQLVVPRISATATAMGETFTKIGICTVVSVMLHSVYHITK